MSWGSVVPVDTWSHVLSWIQIALGLLVNVFVFGRGCEIPSAAVGSGVEQGCVILIRDGVPHLLMRVGNLRCHTLYSPRIRLTLLRRHVTQEGESYFRRDDLAVDQPATMSGIHTVRPRDRRRRPPRTREWSGALQGRSRAC